MSKRYVVPLRNARRMIARGFGVGSDFLHHGKRMVITAVGTPFQEGGRLLFYYDAEEQTNL